MKTKARVVTGVKNLHKYFKEIGVDIALTALYRGVKANTIPHRKISPQVFLFNLDEIDAWLAGDESA
ncbi:hypothetical protein BTO30_14155 [Domibacillus antri]|uniref:Uncharacterized protein n=1 Tax=Domibacillus antri TaxID=1714264 RepID=A0A1Q8Q2R1_9BACI|nr:hypothetical protein [Domibacillus antri]OLN21620.1 hypothetical protein BTO30_14155 [Domibacillus antri]